MKDTWGRYKDPPGRVWELPARREMVNLIGVCGFDVPYRSDFVPYAKPPSSLFTFEGGVKSTSGAEEPLHLSSFADDEVEVLEEPEKATQEAVSKETKRPM